MANHPFHNVLRFIRRTGSAPADPGSDAHLLERFAAARDGEAFAVMVRRHGPLVLGVCRRVLADEHLAEDAFQATFLVLARKAASVRRGASLADWLGRVAFRVALRARKQWGPARTAEVPDLPDSTPSHDPDSGGRSLLDEEVARLPERYRSLIALCYWEGKTYQEAAELLGRPPGTVAGWLARARRMLRRRLLARGVVPAVAAALLATPSGADALPPSLAESTVKATLAGAAGNAALASKRAVALMEGVIRTMFLNRLKIVAVCVMAFAALGTAAGLLLHGSPADRKPDQPRPEPKGESPRPALKVASTFQHNGSVSAVIFSPDGEYLLTAGSDNNPELVNGQSHNGRVRLWQLTKGQEEAGPPPLRYGVLGAALGPDGRYLAVSTNGYLLGPAGRPTLADPGTLAVIDTTGKKATATLGGQAFDNRCLVFSPDGKTLAAGTSPQDVRGRLMQPGGVVALWDVDKGKLTASLKGHKGYVQSVAFSPDGKMLASSSNYATDVKPNSAWKGELKVWDVTTGKETASLQGHEGQVWAVAFSPDGKLLASGGDDGTVRLWDAVKGQEVATLKGHKAGVHTLAFSPDGKFLASGGGDPLAAKPAGELKLWDVATRAEAESLAEHKAPVFAVTFARDGKKLATADTDGVVKVWSLGAVAKP
jgi:RNA polymerase sigma factor (sigma-70 family)